MLVNDGCADAGIWAPCKAGVTILLPRSEVRPSAELDRRALVLENVARLDRAPDAAVAACAEHVHCLCYGARTSAWDTRRFPPLDELRTSAALEEVFSEGEMVVFRVLSCTLRRPKEQSVSILVDRSSSQNGMCLA